MPVQHFANSRRIGLDDKWLLYLRPGRCRQPQTQQPVHRAFERVTGSPDLIFYEPRNIVVKSKSRAHIMMLRN